MGRDIKNFDSMQIDRIRAPSIVVRKENFVDLPKISKCLPEFKPVSSELSQVLSEAKMHVLSYHLPGTSRLSQWSLLYTARRDGYSHITFFEKLENMNETIVAIKDTRGYVFGAFVTEEWHITRSFYGNGYSFVFTFRDGDDLEIYPATGESDFFVQSDERGFIIGGSDNISQRPALSVSDSFARGHSSKSDCYSNERLSSPPLGTSNEEGDFTID